MYFNLYLNWHFPWPDCETIILCKILRCVSLVSAYRMVTSSSDEVGCMAIVLSKSFLVAPILIATAKPCNISSQPCPIMCRPSTWKHNTSHHNPVSLCVFNILWALLVPAYIFKEKLTHYSIFHKNLWRQKIKFRVKFTFQSIYQHSLSQSNKWNATSKWVWYKISKYWICKIKNSNNGSALIIRMYHR